MVQLSVAFKMVLGDNISFATVKLQVTCSLGPRPFV